MDSKAAVQRVRDFYEKGLTKNIAFRLSALRRLEKVLAEMQPEIEAALHEDLGKAAFESRMTETGLVLDELRFQMKHLRMWAADRRVPTPVVHFPSSSRIVCEPYGAVLIMSPWNYPFMLSLSPLIGAVAAGNCVVLKPSAYAPATSALLARLCERCFLPGHVCVVEGGRRENAALLEQRFDYIFFTGSPGVGKLVMEKASRHLTPVSLELGGKSPCIVDQTADIKLAARRIAFGKWLNAGQTCIAPDYVLVHHAVETQFLKELQKATIKFLGTSPLQNTELPKIINRKHFDRLKGLLQGQDIFFGGSDDGTSRIEPTILVNVDPASPVMQEEIFGPVLPVLCYGSAADALRFINAREKPLALYLFCRDSTLEKRVTRDVCFGGGCVNDTIVHVATPHLPFGGVGNSGMGSYHGKASFDTFTHKKSVLKKGTLDIPVRYHPYTRWKQSLLERLL